MSHFTETLKGLMALHSPPLTGVALADRVKISQATVSRLLAGQEPTHEHVGLFCAVISPERERRVELLLAYVRDVVAAAKVAGIDERHFVIAAADGLGERSGTLGADLELLAEECAKHEDVRAIVSDLARMTMRHRAALIDSSNVYRFAEEKSVAAAEDAAPVAEPSASLDGVLVSAAEALKMDKNQRRRVLSQFSDKTEGLRRPGASVNVSESKEASIAHLHLTRGKSAKT